MRTNINAAVTNCTVFGFGQDRAVSSLVATYAHAAQHHASRHASKRARDLDRANKRRGSVIAVVTGAVQLVEQMCLAIIGPQWQPVRRTSPVLVMA